MTATNREVFDAFSTLYAVVLHHRAGAGRRVKWSPQHSAWLRNRDYSRYRSPADCWLAAPGHTFDTPDRPDDDELASAATLAMSITERWTCQRCRHSAPGQHFIAPDVHGEPELYCVQAPSYSVVHSSGGQGSVKHWGSPFGCQAVASHFDSALASDRFIGPVAIYLYGEPLVADEVLAREWCSRCASAAHNVRQGESAAEHARRTARQDRKRLIRELDQYER